MAAVGRTRDADVDDRAGIGIRVVNGAVGDDDERDALDYGGGRVVRSEGLEVARDLEVDHGRLVREITVLVDVDVDALRRAVLEDADEFARDAVTVEVAASLASRQIGPVLLEPSERVRATRCGRRPRRAVGSEGAV